MKLVIDGELPTLNQYSQAERGNRFYGNSVKRIATGRAKIASLEQINKEDFKPPYDLEITWYRKTKRTDKDNIAFALKFILDGLQEADILENDNWANIGDIYHHFEIDKDNPRTVVEFKNRQEK